MNMKGELWWHICTHTHCHNFKVIKWTCQRVACIKKCGREREDGFCVTNIATVLHDHRREPRCYVTAGAIWTDRRVLELHWPTESSILGADPPIVPVAAWEKAFEAVRAVPGKLCHVVLKSGVLIGPQERDKRPFLKDTPCDWLNRPPQIRRLRVHSFAILPRGLRQQREPPSTRAEPFP